MNLATDFGQSFLRFLEKKFDLGRIGIWLGAASNRRLNDKIKKERVRENLFYRFNGLPIDSLPLK